MRSKYTAKNSYIKRLEEQKYLLLQNLKDKIVGFLKAQIISLESKVLSSTRPKDVIIRYKELLREAQRDEALLIRLENKFISNQLEESKIDEPWELISRPTLQKGYIYPVIQNLLLIGLIGGFSLGYIIAVFKEKMSGSIFEESYLESLLNSKVLDRYLQNDSKLVLNKGETFFEELQNNSQNNQIMFLVDSNLNSNSLKSF